MKNTITQVDDGIRILEPDVSPLDFGEIGQDEHFVQGILESINTYFDDELALHRTYLQEVSGLSQKYSPGEAPDIELQFLKDPKHSKVFVDANNFLNLTNGLGKLISPDFSKQIINLVQERLTEIASIWELNQNNPVSYSPRSESGLKFWINRLEDGWFTSRFSDEA